MIKDWFDVLTHWLGFTYFFNYLQPNLEFWLIFYLLGLFAVLPLSLIFSRKVRNVFKFVLQKI